MKRIKIILMVFGGIIASFALSIGIASAHAMCVFNFHQPKVPQGMGKFRRQL